MASLSALAGNFLDLWIIPVNCSWAIAFTDEAYLLLGSVGEVARFGDAG